MSNMPGMPDAWEETWEYGGRIASDECIVFDKGSYATVSAGSHTVSTAIEHSAQRLPGRVRLAVAAPETVRALLAVEWLTDAPWCSRCKASRHDDYYGADLGKHEPDCTLDAALTKAGLPDQASRDAARKKLGY